MKYRKKPVVIEAIQVTWGTISQLIEWGYPAIEFSHNPMAQTKDNPAGQCLIVHTLEGDHVALLGDFIIRDVKGEFYPCKPDIFELTYEPVKES